MVSMPTVIDRNRAELIGRDACRQYYWQDENRRSYAVLTGVR
jgi:hypothetical protein